MINLLPPKNKDKKKEKLSFWNDKLYEKQAGASFCVESDNLIWPHTDPLNPDESPQVNFTTQTERNKEAYQGHLLCGTGLVSLRPKVSSMSHIQGSRRRHISSQKKNHPPKKYSHLNRYTMKQEKKVTNLMIQHFTNRGNIKKWNITPRKLLICWEKKI